MCRKRNIFAVCQRFAEQTWLAVDKRNRLRENFHSVVTELFRYRLIPPPLSLIYVTYTEPQQRGGWESKGMRKHALAGKHNCPKSEWKPPNGTLHAHPQHIQGGFPPDE